MNCQDDSVEARQRIFIYCITVINVSLADTASLHSFDLS